MIKQNLNRFFGWVVKKKGPSGQAKTFERSASGKLKAHWFIAGPIVFIFSVLYGIGFLRGLEYSYINFLFNLRMTIWGAQPVDPRLTLAAIDEKSIQEIGSVPWPRSVYAKLLDELFLHDPAMVIFDIFFSEPDRRNPQEDEALTTATARRKDRVIHAFFERIEPTASGLISASQFLPFDKLKKTGADVGFVDDQRMMGDQIERAKDRDGSMRRTFLSKQTVMGEFSLSLGAQAFAKLKGISAEKFVANYPDEIQINFPGVLITYTQGMRPIPREPYNKFSITDILHRRLSPEAKKSLKNAVIFIASTATGYYDHYPTPYNPMTPGVEIHMYALNNLLYNNYFRVLPNLLTLALIIALGFLIAVFVERFSARINFAFLAALVIGLFGLSLLLFVKKLIVFHVMAIGISSFLVLVAVTLYRMAVEEKEKRWIRSTFNQYLSPKVVSLLVERPDALRLGGEKRFMTVFFLDIAHFTTISEKLAPEELTKLLNYYLTIFTDVILAHDGVVDKFIGDCVMAFWNAPFEEPNHALNACLAALDIRERLKKPREDMLPIGVRVGIHTGQMVVGNMGSSARFNYTVIGDSVNFASRLEGANKFFDTSLLISDAVYEQCREDISVRDLGLIRVVGKENPVGAYELLGLKSDAIETDAALKTWDQAIRSFKSGKIDAGRGHLEEYMKMRPRDPAAQRYAKLLDLGVTKDLVINLTEK
ncbi:MAG: adenylate/guanylate cyclase domain-containing protein [Elusimicrobiota bacterium]